MADLARVLIRVEVDDAGVAPALGRTEDAARQAGARAERAFRPNLAEGAKKATAPAIGVLGALGAAAYSAGQKAADLAETQSKVGQIFGDASAQIETWSDTAPSALGSTKAEAEDAASTFAIFGQAAGLTGNDLADFSQNLVGLGADLGSFYNTSSPEAFEAIGSALRGETEPIRRYGVMLDAASLQAQALSMGLVKAKGDTTKIAQAQISARKAQEAYNKAVKEHGEDSVQASDAMVKADVAQKALAKAVEGTVPPLSNQQKALAASAAIMEQTKVAQGDWGRTNGGLVGTQKQLDATVKDLSTSMGTALLPIISSVSKELLKGAKWATEHQGALKTLVVVVGGLAAGVLVLRGALAVWEVATKAAAAAQWLWNAAMSANPVGLIIVAIAALVAGLVYAYKHSETFRKVVDGALRAVGKAFTWLWEGAKKVFGWLKEHWRTVLVLITGPVGIAVAWVVRHRDQIVEAFKRIPGMLKSLGKGIINVLTWPFRTAVRTIIEAWNGIDIGLGPWQIPSWVPHFGGQSWGIPDMFPDIPVPAWTQGLYTGGTVNRSGWFTVGERGPEQVWLPGSATVLPNGATGGGQHLHFDLRGLTAGDAATLERRLRAAVDDLTRGGALQLLAAGSGVL